jgi:hypothetical protein
MQMCRNLRLKPTPSKQDYNTNKQSQERATISLKKTVIFLKIFKSPYAILVAVERPKEEFHQEWRNP